MSGNEGNDQLLGGPDNDALTAGAGNDIMVGGPEKCFRLWYWNGHDNRF